MKKLKYILIALCLITLVLIIIIINTKVKVKNTVKGTIDQGDSQVNNIDKTRVGFVDYIIAKDCLQRYISELNTDNFKYYRRDENNNFVDVTEETVKKQNIYNLLSEEYIEENNITINNLYNFVETITVQKEVLPYKITRIVSAVENLEIESYYIAAIVFEKSNPEKFDKVYAVVNIDIVNNTFSIRPLEDEESEDIKADDLKSIELKDNNSYIVEEIKDDSIAKEYFENYKYLLLTDAELAYNDLDEEYKEKRFASLEEFKKYINNNKKIFETMRIDQYEVIRNEEYVEYVCVDQYGNIYFLNENETLDYSVLLDAYTIDQPEFIEKYDSANVQEKVVLNIEKIVQAHNMQDYSYIYSKLADSFKNNKYKTQAEFENYIKGALYNNIDVEYKNFSNEGETYIYDIEIKNRDNEEDKVINMQIIMQLKEDRDFVMSFSIK